jgi:hypothetical protein
LTLAAARQPTASDFQMPRFAAANAAPLCNQYRPAQCDSDLAAAMWHLPAHEVLIPRKLRSSVWLRHTLLRSSLQMAIRRMHKSDWTQVLMQITFTLSVAGTNPRNWGMLWFG